MKSKKFSLFTLVLLLSLLLSACGGGSQATEAPGAEVTEAPGAEMTEEPGGTGGEEAASGDCPLPVEEGATITFSGWGDETEQQVYRDSIDRFSSICPGVTVNYTPIPDQFQDKMKAQMAGGTAPDVFYVDDQLMTAFAPTGQLLPLNDYLSQAGASRDDFIPQAMEIFEQDGSVYALPKDWGTLGLVYLPDAFAEAGVEEPTADWTWEDMRAAAQAIAEAGNYGGFCMGADWARFAPFVFSNGGSFTNEDFTQATLDTPEVKEMATFVADMFDEGSLVRPADVGASWCGEAIGKELVAMTTEGGWMVNFMNLTYPDVNWNTVLIPQGPVTRADVMFTNGIGVNAATQFPNAAAALAIYITGADNQAEIVQTGFAYSTHPEHADLIQNPIDQAIAEGGLLEDTRVAYWGPNTGRVNTAVSQALERIFLGDQDVDTAFAQAQEEAQLALDEGQQ